MVLPVSGHCWAPAVLPALTAGPAPRTDLKVRRCLQACLQRGPRCLGVAEGPELPPTTPSLRRGRRSLLAGKALTSLAPFHENILPGQEAFCVGSVACH